MTGTLTLPAGMSRTHLHMHLFTRRNTRKAAAIQAFAEKRKAASLYEVLRVRRNASATEIKKAYRNLAKQYHPDASRSRTDAYFMEIQNAYETLADPTARAIYDLSLGSGRQSSVMNGFRFHPTWRWETDQCW